ncbi:MAG: DUF3634 family protein [Polyangiales bacterium]
MGLFVALAALVSIAALIIAATRAREVCVLSVRDGKLAVTRGGLPGYVLEALGDVVRRGRVERATIRVLRDGDRARVDASGLDAQILQQTRNVIGIYPLAKLLAAPRLRAR